MSTEKYIGIGTDDFFRASLIFDLFVAFIAVISSIAIKFNSSATFATVIIGLSLAMVIIPSILFSFAAFKTFFVSVVLTTIFLSAYEKPSALGFMSTAITYTPIFFA